MKLIKTFIAFLLTGMVLAACSSDNEDNAGEVDKTPLTEIEKNLVGGWPSLGNNGITFLRNGILVHDGEVGHWQYDETTKILTTDIVDNKKQALIWEISMLQDGSMAGLQIWDGKTFAAKRNVEQALKDIIYAQSWTRNKDYKLLVIDFYAINKDIRYSYKDHNGNFWIGYNDVTISEQDFTSITIESREYGKHVIYNPYDYDKIWFEFPDGRKYYPVKEGMTDLENIKMSKEESKLVGRWICKEQIWDRKSPGHLYFEDEYGMEFTDGYWAKMWAGSDQLMEVMNGREFSWWINGDKLYVDNDCYYILKLTDKEMDLEWRDAGNIITCKFYKYNKDEGLLIDQMEYVDLGLSVKWATRNLGAEDKKSSSKGSLFAWGETSTKEEFTLDNYKYCKKDERFYWWYGLTKYCSDPHLGYNGFVDNKTTLDPEDDAATAIRGKDWRMPTMEEFQELIDKCTWTWGYDANQNAGYKITGKTGYYIFLPITNLHNGYYLTNSTGEIIEYSDIPFITLICFSRDLNPHTNKNYLSKESRAQGYSIRPVYK